MAAATRLLKGFKTQTPEGREVVWSIIQDISALKDAQRELEDREQRLQQLAAQSRTVTWEIDAEGCYTYLSPVAESVWGYTPAELVGREYFYELHPAEGREAFKDRAFEGMAQTASRSMAGQPDRPQGWPHHLGQHPCRAGRR